MLPAFFVIGIAFVAIGVGLLYFTNGILEHEIDYTDCKNSENEFCYVVINDTTITEPCECKMKFTLDKDWDAPVYLYYGLTNLYQNHRRYVKSRDEKQLLGDIEKDPSDDCTPYDYDNDKKIVPCGAIANSLFNGTKQHWNFFFT